jgi:iron complex outermembrane receptor protein
MKFTAFSVPVLVTAAFGFIPTLAAQELEEIVVTAQKREQSVQDVGIAISTYSGEQLRNLGLTSAQDVSALAPNVTTVQPNGPSNYALAIRGVVQNDFVTNQESPVSIYMDEVYISQMSGAGFQLFDTERVEILKGPQGTLFGRNATGGLAHFVTVKPSQNFNGYGQMTFGEHEQVNFEGAVGGAVSDAVSSRLSLAATTNGGYVKNRFTGEDINNSNDYAGRVQFLIEPSDSVDILLNARGSFQEIRTGFWENVSTDPLSNLTPDATNFNGYRDGDGNVFAGDYDRIGFQDAHTWGTTANIKIYFDNVTFTSITDWQRVYRDYQEDSDASPLPDFNFYLVTDARQFSQELRLSGETDRSRWVGGFYLLDVDVKDANGAETPLIGVAGAFGLPPGGLTDGSGVLPTREGDGTFQGNDNPYHTNVSSWSIFAQAEYDFNDQFTGIIGGRYINENKDHHYENNFVDFQPGFVMRDGNPNILFNAGTYDGALSRSLWSAKLELDWKPNDDLLVYGSWNRGVKGGGFNSPLDITCGDPVACPTGFLPLTDDIMRFNEETLYAYELGFKATLFDGRATLNGAAFYYDYKDFQAFRIVGLSTFIFNADAESYGGELDLTARPLDGLDFQFGVGYVNPNIPDVDLGIGLGPQDTEPVQAPHWTLSGLARYQWPMFGGDGAVQMDFRLRSKHYFSLTRFEPSTEDGYVVANARVSYVTGDKHWEAALFVKNFTDEEYLVQTFDLGFVLGMTEQYFGLPRWFGGSVSYSW